MTTKIISTSKHKKTFETIFTVLLIVILILTLFFRNPSNISFCKKWFNDTIGSIVLIIYFILVILLLVFYVLSRKRKQLGKLTLTPELIEIEILNQKSEYKISELDNFRIESKYLKSRKELASLAGSIDNWIVFDFKNETFKYQFQITSGYDRNRFIELMADWSKNDNFKSTNEK